VAETLRVRDAWLGRRLGPAAFPLADGVLEVGTGTGTVLPGLVDTHVHLGLVDYPALANSAVAEVHDLGWRPGAADSWRAGLGASVEVKAAGPFHTAPGGYPSGRAWAPSGSVRAVSTPAEAGEAVASAAGAHTIKVTLHTGAPLLTDAVLEALVEAAHRAGLPVCVHAEGAGQAARALAAGADVLVHAPWTETLDDSTLRAMAGRLTWISTLGIHSGAAREIAMDNTRRFLAAGGEVRYGTDMGNGPTPVGVNPAEILALGEAGLAGDALLTALTGVETADPISVGRLLYSSEPLPHTAAECVSWFSAAQRVPEVSAK
jgi:imidazolonepropionase-like amidohydrolase